MTNRPHLRAFRLPLWALAPFAPLALAAACDNGDETAPPTPPGEIAIAIQELLPRGAEHWLRGDAQPVTLGCDLRLGVTVDFYDPVAKATAEDNYQRLMDAGLDAEPPGPPPDGDWLLRTAGACGGHEQCGTLAITVEPVGGGPSVSAQAALATVLVDLTPLGDAAYGELRIHAELRENGVATEAFRKRGLPVVDEIDVAFRADDCEPGGAGAGGMPSGTGGTTATGGSGGTGNRGGEGGAGATGGTGQGGGGHGGEAGAPAGAGGAPGGAGGEAGGT
ncbi:MAG TPA: hypothetical protein VF103_10055 [Polyangiaceae bacterium]